MRLDLSFHGRTGMLVKPIVVKDPPIYRRPIPWPVKAAGIVLLFVFVGAVTR